MTARYGFVRSAPFVKFVGRRRPAFLPGVAWRGRSSYALWRGGADRSGASSQSCSCARRPRAPASVVVAALAFAACDVEPSASLDLASTTRWMLQTRTCSPRRAARLREASVDAPFEADADAGPSWSAPSRPAPASRPTRCRQRRSHLRDRGPTRSLYCWGANDHGQIGNGKTGAATFTEDVPTATKIAVDETGLPFDGLEEVSLAAWHSCARKGDVSSAGVSASRARRPSPPRRRTSIARRRAPSATSTSRASARADRTRAR